MMGLSMQGVNQELVIRLLRQYGIEYAKKNTNLLVAWVYSFEDYCEYVPCTLLGANQQPVYMLPLGQRCCIFLGCPSLWVL